MAAERRSLERLLRPKSVVVVGGVEAERVVDQLDRFGFDGEIWPVHPSRSEIRGRRCLRSVEEVPGSPDVAFVAVPAKQTPTIVSGLAGVRAGSIVVYSSGFGEAGNHDLQTALVEAAGDVPLVGPNTYGYVNALDRTAIWPDVHGMRAVGEGVGIITQSGNIGINLTMARRSLDIGVLVTAGNLAELDISDYLAEMVQDDRIRGVGIQLESLANPESFGAAAEEAARRGVPIVALKMGSSLTGSLITASHTGAMAGESDVYDAYFAHYGISAVSSIPSFLETLKLADRVKEKPRLVSLSASGGEAAHVADLAEIHGVELPVLEDDHIARVESTVDDLVTVGNPMDYHTVSWGDGDSQAMTFASLVDGPFDVAMLVLDFPAGDIPEEWWTACGAFAEAIGHRPGLVVSTLPENLPERAQERLVGMGLIPMLGLVETMEALGSIRASRRRAPLLTAPRLASATTLDEVESKRILQTAGLSVPKGEVVSDPVDGSVGYPRTIKSVGIDHKASVGGVAVGLPDEGAVTRRVASMPPTEEYLVEETVEYDSSELLLNLRATELGWMVTVASGGTDVETADNRAHLMVPADPSDLAEAVERLKMTGIDLDILIETVDRLVATVEEDASIMEIEVNPLVMTDGEAIALDAMVSKQ